MSQQSLDPTAIAAPDTGWRLAADRSCRAPVLLFLGSAVVWLLVGTVLAIVASIKMHSPGLLAGSDWLTFGRIRPAHLSTVIYGWGSMAGIGVLLWLEARLCRVKLPLQLLLVVAGVLWNVGVAGGTLSILLGNGTSVEWLEFPRAWSFLFAGAFVVIMAASLLMFSGRRVSHIYVSQWYLFGAVLWFPFLYLLGNALIHGRLGEGVVQAATNWWFAHNVLGLWFTPIGLAAVYYLLPKVLGRPIHSYYLSILGFWTLALFYNWAGTHHLIGGPLPAWLITVGIVGSVMMVIPVTTVAINHHMTTKGHFHRLRTSPTLRFIVFGAMSYTVVSFQGSLQSLRFFNEITHFTHYTVAHAHLGVYSFFTMAMFGAIYYIAPRLTGREWHSATLIKLHFWGSAMGILAYWIGLSLGGVVQGVELNDPDVPFLDVVGGTLPFLWSRTCAGVLLTVGHVAFALLVWRMFRTAVVAGPAAASQAAGAGGPTGGGA